MKFLKNLDMPIINFIIKIILSIANLLRGWFFFGNNH
jgi:hypothetical protein